MPEKRCDASTLMVVTVLMSPMYTFAVAPHLAAADSLYLQHGEKLSKEGWPRRRPQRRWQQARHWEAEGGRAAVAIAKVERGAKAKPEAEAMKRKAQDRCGGSGLRRVTRSRAAASSIRQRNRQPTRRKLEPQHSQRRRRTLACMRHGYDQSFSTHNYQRCAASMSQGRGLWRPWSLVDGSNDIYDTLGAYLSKLSRLRRAEWRATRAGQLEHPT